MELLPVALLLFLGLLLLLLEIYVTPGFQLAGIGGLLLLVAASLYAFVAYGFWEGMAVLGLSSLISLSLVYLLFRLGIWDQLALHVRLRPGAAQPRPDIPTRFLGKRGKALTPLRPTGMAELDGERVEVTTEGSYIAAGSPIRVVAVDRRHVFVRLDAETE